MAASVAVTAVLVVLAGSSWTGSLAFASTAAAASETAPGYTPRRLEEAYGILPLLKHGVDGRGETVVLPELAEPQFPLPTSDIRRDLAQFDKLFHLPAARVRVVSTLAPSATPWLANGEEVLDTEMVHAIAPRAAIVEVLVKGTSLNNSPNAVAASVAALRLGTSLGAVISISAAGQTGGEHCDTRAEVAALHSALRNAANHHVTVVAASGDVGAVGEPCHVFKGLVGGSFPPVREANLPASDPLVLAVGGTTLTASHTTGAYIRERAWGLPFGKPGSQFQASGGGVSRVFARPSYQKRIPALRSHRGVPDVAATAAPDSLAVVTSTGGGTYAIEAHGGTSASAPLWAGLIALADQHASRQLGFVNAALYRIAGSSRNHQAFHDVTAGSNTVRFPPKTMRGSRAAPGWDAVTGWGSPNASVLIPLLARYAFRSASSRTPTAGISRRVRCSTSARAALVRANSPPTPTSHARRSPKSSTSSSGSESSGASPTQPTTAG
jgi:subtilase family serine protease